MKELKYTLYTNNNVVTQEKCRYYEKSNTIYFKANNELYEYSLSDHILHKKNTESHISIHIDKELIIIKLLKENYAFEMPITNVTHQITESNIKIEYTFISDEENTNCIIIEL